MSGGGELSVHARHVDAAVVQGPGVEAALFREFEGLQGFEGAGEEADARGQEPAEEQAQGEGGTGQLPPPGAAEGSRGRGPKGEARDARAPCPRRGGGVRRKS